MWKVLYELITSPLWLPINAFLEYLIIFVIGEITHEIAFGVSPGGKEFGSIIYWLTKILFFVAIWAILYGIIVAIQFITKYWIWFVSIGGVVAILVETIILILKYKKKKNIAHQ